MSSSGGHVPAFQDRRRGRGGGLCGLGHQSLLYMVRPANRQESCAERHRCWQFDLLA
jgi:hypothetical protein